MIPLRYLTLAGPCERIDVPRALALSGRSAQRIEWALRLDARRAGRAAGYPGLPWAGRFAEQCASEGAPLALHLCARLAEALLGEGSESDALRPLLARAGRVQLEALPEHEPVSFVRRLRAHLERLPGAPGLCVRANLRYPVLVRTLGAQAGLQVLLERPASGRSWPSLKGLEALKPGFRGALGSANLAPELQLLLEHTRGEAFWIQLDEQVTGADGALQLERCEDCLTQLLRLEQVAGIQAGAHWGEGERAVASLSGWWLDWWVAASQGLAPMVPPAQACSAVLLERRTGHFEAYRVTDHPDDAMRVLSSEGILLEPGANARSWSAWPRSAPLCRQAGSSFLEAGLRAVVAKHFGARVPANPMRHPGLGGALEHDVGEASPA